MIRKIKVTDHPRLMEIWESAVLNTHDFLKEEDFLYYKEQLPVYFQHVTLFGFEQEGILVGFMGIAKGNLEMLFIDNNYRGIGIGKKLITYAIDNLQVTNKSRKTKCDGREKRNVIFEAKTKCAQKSRLLPLSSQNTSVVQTPFESCLNDAFLLNFLLKYHLKPIANLAKNRIFT